MYLTNCLKENCVLGFGPITLGHRLQVRFSVKRTVIRKDLCVIFSSPLDELMFSMNFEIVIKLSRGSFYSKVKVLNPLLFSHRASFIPILVL